MAEGRITYAREATPGCDGASGAEDDRQQRYEGIQRPD